MFSVDEIVPLTDFQRNTKRHLRQLKDTGRPEVLTVNGKAAVIVQDAASYQRFLDTLECAEAIAGIHRGLQSVERGEGRPAAEAFDALRHKHGIPRE